jgi:hypothetical protein
MRVYYLENPLSASEIAEVERLMGWSVELERVACLLPAGELVDGVERIPGAHEAPVAPLKAAGILTDYGQRTALVAFSPHHWTVEFVEAIGRLTGCWPYLIQTENSRSEIGNPGELRVLDMDGAMRS